MTKRYAVGLDQSTQGTKAILADERGEIVGKAFRPHQQIISPEGWVSHDGEEIYRNCLRVLGQLAEEAGITGAEVAALGISNQRETTIAWDGETGKPLGHAIVWQCDRALEITREITDEEICERLGIPLGALPAVEMSDGDFGERGSGR